ncbi:MULTISPECIES: hypothetical protein [Gammaproteobacteria]|jgi:hypothetical protein|uniref:Uncharacterized protein n=2 Tax=Aeromonas salmonicida TaxID=645 RepID=A0A189PGX0_AERSS|nr:MULTISPECIES: hypothetical protein [Aeromonas]ALL42456.1 hypothetical protein [Aeromonas salmonicida subsp. salmonicida]MDD1845466.1 hypothetical protein [Aeromonas veronii]MDE8812261.1 hypothetical protein [Aeromonas hydrophila]MDF8327109.1 hypothetical protein [Aeromonas salmonicida]MDK3166381.1 hypothetical protein [Aeromonas caviae]
MTASVSATELAKLGKCASLIKSVSKDSVAVNRDSCRQRTLRPVKQSPSLSLHNENTLRGEQAHLRYESAAQRLMNHAAQAKHQFYRVVFSATVAMGLLTLLAAWTTN